MSPMHLEFEGREEPATAAPFCSFGGAHMGLEMQLNVFVTEIRSFQTRVEVLLFAFPVRVARGCASSVKYVHFILDRTYYRIPPV